MSDNFFFLGLGVVVAGVAMLVTPLNAATLIVIGGSLALAMAVPWSFFAKLALGFGLPILIDQILPRLGLDLPTIIEWTNFDLGEIQIGMIGGP